MSDLKRNVQRAVRCPQRNCRSTMVELTEIGVHIVLRYIRQPDNTMKRVRIEKRMLDSYVEGRCEVCDNTWKVRGVEHLTELEYHFPKAKGNDKTKRRSRTTRPISGPTSEPTESRALNVPGSAPTPEINPKSASMT